MRKFFFLSVLLLFIQCDPAPKTSIQAAVVSARIEASEAGKTVMMQGGNAYDAMVATSFALTVVYPVAGNITGGGFFVYRTAEGETGTLDYREMAPLEATKDLYIDENGDVIPKLSTVGGLAVGIPGAVAGILEVHRKLGSLPLDQLLAPAIKLAEEGYIVTEKQAKSFKRYRDLFIEVNGEDTFFAQEHKAGDRIINLPLANTLKAIAAKGEASRSVLFQQKIPSTSVWENDWATYQGDKRALTEEELVSLSLFFLTNSQARLYWFSTILEISLSIFCAVSSE